MVNCRNCIKDKKCSKPFENEDDLQMQYHGRVLQMKKHGLSMVIVVILKVPKTPNNKFNLTRRIE